jgi:hypothetical protein
MMVIGCDNKTTSGGGGGGGGGGASPTTQTGKSLTINGLNGKSGEVIVFLSSTMDDDAPVAHGVGDISNNSVKLNLMKGFTTSSWTESGSYIIDLIIDDGKDDEYYLYTNGQELTLTVLLNPPKFNFSSANSTISFNQFKKIDL